MLEAIRKEPEGDVAAGIQQQAQTSPRRKNRRRPQISSECDAFCRLESARPGPRARQCGGRMRGRYGIGLVALAWGTCADILAALPRSQGVADVDDEDIRAWVEVRHLGSVSRIRT